jgi:hypothetical protein
MIGYCCSTCFNCEPGCGKNPPVPSPPPNPTPAPKPTPVPKPTPAPAPGEAVRFEAEDGSLSGATKVDTTIKGFSGTGYVTGFSAQTCQVTIPFSVKTTGLYEIKIGYHAGYG